MSESSTPCSPGDEASPKCGLNNDGIAKGHLIEKMTSGILPGPVFCVSSTRIYFMQG